MTRGLQLQLPLEDEGLNDKAKALIFRNAALGGVVYNSYSYCSFTSLADSRPITGIWPGQESMARPVIVGQVAKISSLLKIR